MAYTDGRLWPGGMTLSAGIVLLLALCGCPQTEPNGLPDDREYMFFPEPPDTARVQFLCNLRGSMDVGDQADKKPRGLAGFILGEEEQEKYDIIGKPYGVAVRDGKVYVADTLKLSVAIMDVGKGRFSRFGRKGQGKLRKPINIRFDASGLCYVTDTVKDGQIIVYDGDGNYKRRYGKPGDFKPADVAITPEELFVLDIEGNCVKVYDLATGDLKRTFGTKGRGLGEFNGPTNMVFGPGGNLYVADSINQRVQKLSPTGKPLAIFGQHGRGPGKFFRPKGIAVDREGLIYVVDTVVGLVQLLDPQGRPLMFIGGHGEEPGRLMLPTQIVLDYDNIDHFRKYLAPDFEPQYLIFITNQYGGHKVSVYAFGRRKGQG